MKRLLKIVKWFVFIVVAAGACYLWPHSVGELIIACLIGYMIMVMINTTVNEAVERAIEKREEWEREKREAENEKTCGNHQ